MERFLSKITSPWARKRDILYNTLYMKEALERAKKIKAILTDVDGILTDGKVNFFVRDDGKIDEFKSFHTQDGIAVLLCHSAQIVCGIITGRRHPTTVERAKNLGFKYMYQGFLTKIGPLNDILEKEQLSPEQVAYIGDDITDIPLLKEVGEQVVDIILNIGPVLGTGQLHPLIGTALCISHFCAPPRCAAAADGSAPHAFRSGARPHPQSRIPAEIPPAGIPRAASA